LKLKRGEVALAFQNRQIVAIDQPEAADMKTQAAE
jgi:ribonuclease D